MKRNLLFPIILTQALNAYSATGVETKSILQSFDERLQALCPDNTEVDIESVQQNSNKIWNEIVNQLNNAKLDSGFEQSANLSNRATVTFGKDSGSEPSIGGKYSGIDKWKVGISALFFGSSAFDIGVSGTREVTFIQQFASRCKSLIRTAYDPITKLPTSSQRALSLKPGDFVAFSSPLTLGLGKSLDQFLKNTSDMRALGGVSYYATGEFNIHVYRMEGKNVRVRFFAAKTKGIDVNLGVKFLVLNNLVGLRPLEINVVGASNSDIFSADYVFNLDNQNAIEMYDKLMGKKLSLTQLNFEGTNPLVKDNTVKNKMYADMGAIEEAALQDMNLPINSRRVIRLSQGDTHTESHRSGVGSDLKVVKLSKRVTYSDSKVSMFNVENENKRYQVKSISRESKVNFFQLFGQEDSHNTALLVETDGNARPLFSKGIQSIRNKEELNFSKAEITGLKNRLNEVLPSEISSTLQFPDIDHLSGSITNARIEQSIFLDTEKIEKQNSITYDKVKLQLEKQISSWGKINAEPLDVDMNASTDNLVSRAKAKKEADIKKYYNKDATAKYLEAFSYELGYIPTYLSTLFGNDSIDQKLIAYGKLQEIPLFNELGIVLVLNLIANDGGQSKLKLSDVVTYRLSITGRGIEDKITEFPALKSGESSMSLKNSELFQRILNDNGFLTDRSFNLRYYMNEKGDSWTLQQVVDRAK